MKRLVLIATGALITSGVLAVIDRPALDRRAGAGASAAEPADDLMTARPCPTSRQCIQTWTLTSRLGHIIETYESLLGARNHAYRLLGIEFTTTNRPRIWYPDFGNGTRHVIVQLTDGARRDPSLALGDPHGLGDDEPVVAGADRTRPGARTGGEREDGEDLGERTTHVRAIVRRGILAATARSRAAGTRGSIRTRHPTPPPFVLGSTPDARGATNFCEAMLRIVENPPLPQIWR